MKTFMQITILSAIIGINSQAFAVEARIHFEMNALQINGPGSVESSNPLVFRGVDQTGLPYKLLITKNDSSTPYFTISYLLERESRLSRSGSLLTQAGRSGSIVQSSSEDADSNSRFDFSLSN